MKVNSACRTSCILAGPRQSGCSNLCLQVNLCSSVFTCIHLCLQVRSDLQYPRWHGTEVFGVWLIDRKMSVKMLVSGAPGWLSP